jgi:hypothetical protein
MGKTATCGHEARQEETTMIAFVAMEQERLAFLYELYTRSAGDARQGIPYEALINALGFGEALTKQIQTRAPTGRVGGTDRRPSDDHGGSYGDGLRASAAPSSDDRHDTSGYAAHGGDLNKSI